MKLSRKKLLKSNLHCDEIEKLLNQVEKTIKTWEPSWSLFFDAPIQKEMKDILNQISDIAYSFNGGFPKAERKRLFLQRKEHAKILSEESLPINAIQIEGNFLFDRVVPNDFRAQLKQIGIAVEQIGDIWVIGDRGAQAICTREASEFLQNKTGNIREVQIQYKAIDLKNLRIPISRTPRKITTVEASKRLDAIASAGFGLSRSKVINQIKQGRLRLNWKPIKNTSRSLDIGDQIQFEGKGSIEVKNLELTKRDRWRVELLRE